MIMTKDDHYVVLMITNSNDAIIAFCNGLTENSYVARQSKVRRPLECNIEYNSSKISTIYYKADEYEQYRNMVDILTACNVSYLDNLLMEV